MSAGLPVDAKVTHFRLCLANGAGPVDVLFVAGWVNAKSFFVVRHQVDSRVETLQVCAFQGADRNFDACCTALKQNGVPIFSNDFSHFPS